MTNALSSLSCEDLFLACPVRVCAWPSHKLALVRVVWTELFEVGGNDGRHDGLAASPHEELPYGSPKEVGSEHVCCPTHRGLPTARLAES